MRTHPTWCHYPLITYLTLHVTSYKKIPAVSEFLRCFPILKVAIFVEYTQNAILSTHLIRPYSLISAHYVCTYVHNNISHSIIKLRHLKFLCTNCTYLSYICNMHNLNLVSQKSVFTYLVHTYILLRLKISTNSNMKSSLFIAKIRYKICEIWFQPKNLPRVP